MILGRGRAASDSDTLLSPFFHHYGRRKSAPNLIQSMWLDENIKHPSKPPDYSNGLGHSPWSVLPREEEGREELPRYSSSVYYEGCLFYKCELLTPFRRSAQRAWHRVHVLLNNTQLRIYSVTNYRDSFNPGSVKPIPDVGEPFQPTYTIGKLLRSYTLQYAEVGIAADYHKHPFVSRVRAELEQFLFSFDSQEQSIQWTNALQSAIDLALPLEERDVPKNQTVPRRNCFCSENFQIMASTNPISRIYSRFIKTSKPPKSTTNQTEIDSIYSSDSDVESIDLDNHEEHTSPAGKWTPFHEEQSRKDYLNYAQRCLLLLPSDTPWTDKPVVVGGKKMIVRTDRFQSCEPPLLCT